MVPPSAAGVFWHVVQIDHDLCTVDRLDLNTRYGMLCGICIVQIQPRKRALYHARCTTPTQHELHHTKYRLTIYLPCKIQIMNCSGNTKIIHIIHITCPTCGVFQPRIPLSLRALTQERAPQEQETEPDICGKKNMKLGSGYTEFSVNTLFLKLKCGLL